MYRRSHGLFVRPVLTKTDILLTFNIDNRVFKLINTTGWSNKNARIKNGTKHMDLEQEQVHYMCSLSKLFMIAFYDSYSIFIILSLCCQEEISMSILLKDNGDDDDKESALIHSTKLIHFTKCITGLAQPPQCLQMNNALELFTKLNQYDKISHPFLVISLCTLSGCELNWNYFQNTLWLPPASFGIYFTFMPILRALEDFIPNIDTCLKIYSILSIVGDINDENLTFIIDNKEKVNGLRSAVIIFMLSDHNSLYCCTVPLEGCFVVIFVKCQANLDLLLKEYTDDQRNLNNNICSISTVSVNVS